jgi:hypothetical protein
MLQRSGHKFLYNVLPEIFGKSLYTYFDPLLGVVDVSGESWQLVTALHDEGDSLTLSECLS